MGVPNLKKLWLCYCYGYERKRHTSSLRQSLSLRVCAQHFVTPINRLPNELISQILLFAIEDADDRLDATLLPSMLSRVCSRWRRVALATSGLWTKITIAFPPTQEQLLRTTNWLSRSRAQPLDILLDFRDPLWDWELAESDHDLDWQDVDTVLRLLLAHVKRWKRFELLSDTWMPVFTFLCYTRDVASAPLLESLRLFRCNAYFANQDATFSPREMKTPIPLFGGTMFGSLSELTLAGVHVDWTASSLRNLKTLEMKYLANDVAPSMDEFLDILSACPRLQQLSIRGRGPRIELLPTKDVIPSAEHSTPHSRAYLPDLRQLDLGFTDAHHAIELLKLLDIPFLDNLSIQGIFFDLGVPFPRPLDATPLLRWLSDSESDRVEDGKTSTITISKITSLRLEEIDCSQDTFTAFFSKLHDLQRLTLHRSSNSCLRVLSPSNCSSRTASICSKLAELDCYYQDPGVLVNTLEACCRLENPTTLLNSISFTTTDEIPSHTLSRLYELGVDVRYELGPEDELDEEP